jgi:hypothetical protein
MDFKQYFYTLISEMVVSGSTGNRIIAHRGNIWRFDDFPDESQLRDIVNKTGVLEMEGDEPLDEEELNAAFDEIYQAILDERPDIFIGRINGQNYLQNDSDNELTYGPDSPMINKMVRMLKTDGYQAADSDYTSGETYWSSELKGDLPEWAYHGTNLSGLASIIKYGLNPSEENAGNWGFQFGDKIYLTTKQDYAIYHANNSARKQGSPPILFRIRIPDRNRITVDYDVAKTYGIHDKADEEGYSGIISNHTHEYDRKRNKLISQYSPKTDWTKATGVFAYKGRIPAKFIQWIGYKDNYDGYSATDEESSLSQDEMQVLHDFSDIKEFLDMMQEYGYYDPVFLQQMKEDEEEYD